MTTKDYIIAQLQAFDPTLNLTDNDALVDLLVNPASAFLDPVAAQITFLMNNIGLVDPASIDSAELDAILGNFLIPRLQGANATGVVEFFYNNPVDLDIPAGTTVTSSAGIVFQTIQALHIPLSTMANNTWNFPRYSTGPIPVTAINAGSIGSIPPNDIKSTNLLPAPALVTNPSAFTGGLPSEDNVTYVNRVLISIIAKSLGSSSSIFAALTAQFPTIEGIKVRGMNDLEMLRDLTYSGIAVYSNYQKVDYYGKVSGLNSLPSPQSVAYWNIFYDDPSTSGLIPDLPSSSQFVDEFATSQYQGVYALNDSYQAQFASSAIFSDNFKSSALNPAWTTSDSTRNIGSTNDAHEFSLVTVSGIQMLRIGYRYNGSMIDQSMITTVPVQVFYNAINSILQAISMGPVPLPIGPVVTYADITALLSLQKTRENTIALSLLQDLAKNIQIENAQNYQPIITAPLGQSAGITFTGRFMTDDSSTDGRLSYVTVLRDATSLDPTNGYGFAWMKGDGSIYNVYLVDNSPLANDLFISPTSIVLNQGNNPFLAAGRIAISVNRLYDFKLVIGTDYSMSIKIWADGDAEPALAQVNTGAPSSVAAAGTTLGIGILGTQNSQWWYDNFLVQSTTGVHTAVLYRLKADPAIFPNGSFAQVNHWGWGYDGLSTYGLSAFIKKFVNSAWTWVSAGTNTSTNSSDRNATKITYPFTMGTDYRDTDNFIDVLFTATNSLSTVTNVTSYYVDLENATLSGIHTGGAADIYINDPKSVLVAQQTVNNVTGDLSLSLANGFMGPIHSIIDVQTALVGQSLAENTDWVLVTPNVSTAFSPQEAPYLTFNSSLVNTKVLVTYRFYAYGNAVQSLIVSDPYRYSGTSNLAKIMPPVMVTINTLKYRGAASVSQVQSALIDYVTAQIDSVVLDDLLNAVYAAGVSYIDKTSLDIEITEYNYQRVRSASVPLLTSYTKPDLTAFYTDSYEMSGVIKQ
jgi:hypothetical protein